MESVIKFLRKVLAYTLGVCLVATAAFGSTPEGWTWTLLCARALIGFSQAFLMVLSYNILVIYYITLYYL